MIAALTLAGLAAATTVACVGDSITSGVDVTPGRNYPTVLGDLLGPDWTVEEYGHHGATARTGGDDSYWDSREYAASLAAAPDVVVLMLGTNDALSPPDTGDPDNRFEGDYSALAASWTGAAVWMVEPPPIVAAKNIDADARLRDELDPIIAARARAGGREPIDVRAAFGDNPTQYFGAGDGVRLGDGIHPNDAGAALIAATVDTALEAAADSPVPPSQPPGRSCGCAGGRQGVGLLPLALVRVILGGGAKTSRDGRRREPRRTTPRG